MATFISRTASPTSSTLTVLHSRMRARASAGGATRKGARGARVGTNAANYRCVRGRGGARGGQEEGHNSGGAVQAAPQATPPQASTTAPPTRQADQALQLPRRGRHNLAAHAHAAHLNVLARQLLQAHRHQDGGQGLGTERRGRWFARQAPPIKVRDLDKVWDQNKPQPACFLLRIHTGVTQYSSRVAAQVSQAAEPAACCTAEQPPRRAPLPLTLAASGVSAGKQVARAYAMKSRSVSAGMTSA